MRLPLCAERADGWEDACSRGEYHGCDGLKGKSTNGNKPCVQCPLHLTMRLPCVHSQFVEIVGSYFK